MPNGIVANILENTETPFRDWSNSNTIENYYTNINFFDENNTSDEQEYQKTFGNIEIQIDNFSNLPENWDSYNANTIDAPVLNRAKRLIRDMFFIFNDKGKSLPEPFVSPCPDGSIQFEWDLASKEIEILIPYSEQAAISYLTVENDVFSEAKITDNEELSDLFE